MTAPAVAVKAIDALFAGTVTVAGTVRIGALLERATRALPGPVLLERLRVQVDGPGAIID